MYICLCIHIYIRNKLIILKLLWNICLFLSETFWSPIVLRLLGHTHTHIHRNLQHSFVLGNLSISRKLRKKAKYSSESLLFFEYPWAFWMHLFEIIYDEDQRWNCTSNQTHRAVHIVHSRSDCCKKNFFIYLLLWAQSL